MGRRVVEWEDPLESAGRAAGVTGLQHLQGLVDGTVPPPPMARLLGMELVEVAEGSATFRCEPDESVYNTIGTVHGGFVCTLLDSAAGCAVQTTLAPGWSYTSIDLQVSYLRPLHHHSGVVTCIGTVVKPGRRVAFAEARVLDGEGRVVATATSSLLVMPPT
jgi:uncharacterized protein (TIGR00369 family)